MEIVIFSNIYSLIAMGVTLLLYVASAAVGMLGEELTVLKNIVGVLCIISQIVMFGVFFYIKASAQEIMFALMISTALALVTTAPRKEKK